MIYLKELRNIRIKLFIIIFFISQIHIVYADFECSTVSEIPTVECEELVALYNSAGGSSWTNNTGWLASNARCSWHGVECDNGRVVKLDLGWNNFSGNIPSEI